MSSGGNLGAKGEEMKFSFVNPGANLELPMSEKKKMIGSSPPLGMLYIAAILMNEGIEVSMLDQAANGFSVKNTVDWVKREDPDILGFSTLMSSGRTAAAIAGKVKRENPKITIVFGNFHATFNAGRILRKYPFVDLIVRGEGEYTSLELAKCQENGKDLKKVLGITFRKEGRIISTPDRPLIRDVDSIPFPDRGLLDVEYHNTTGGVIVAPKKFSGFLSSRGCVYRCRFCGCQRLARSLWRPRSVENIIDELHLLASEGYKQFMFVDDNFTLNPKRVIRLCRRIRKEKIDIEWICEGRVDYCPYDMMREMVKAGCIMLYLGIESANQRVLDYYDKRITPEQSRNAVKTARNAGVDIIVGSFIVGAPHETRREIQNTLRFAQQLDLDIPQFNILAAFPGMDIWDELKVEGVLNEDKFWETGVIVSEISSDTVPCEEIKRMVHRHFRRFFFRPSYILTEAMRTLKSSYRINVMIDNLKQIDPITNSFRHIA